MSSRHVSSHIVTLVFLPKFPKKVPKFLSMCLIVTLVSIFAQNFRKGSNFYRYQVLSKFMVFSAQNFQKSLEFLSKSSHLSLWYFLLKISKKASNFYRYFLILMSLFPKNFQKTPLKISIHHMRSPPLGILPAICAFFIHGKITGCPSSSPTISSPPSSSSSSSESSSSVSSPSKSCSPSVCCEEMQ